MPTTKPKTSPKPTKKQPSQVGGGDYSKILNPATGKHVQAGGAVGKKLMKNYKYATIMNPATGKMVKTDGKFGGNVLKKYKNKVGGDEENDVKEDMLIKLIKQKTDAQKSSSLKKKNWCMKDYNGNIDSIFCIKRAVNNSTQYNGIYKMTKDGTFKKKTIHDINTINDINSIFNNKEHEDENVLSTLYRVYLKPYYHRFILDFNNKNQCRILSLYKNKYDFVDYYDNSEYGKYQDVNIIKNVLNELIEAINYGKLAVKSAVKSTGDNAVNAFCKKYNDIFGIQNFELIKSQAIINNDMKNDKIKLDFRAKYRILKQDFLIKINSNTSRESMLYDQLPIDKTNSNTVKRALNIHIYKNHEVHVSTSGTNVNSNSRKNSNSNNDKIQKYKNHIKRYLKTTGKGQKKTDEVLEHESEEFAKIKYNKENEYGKGVEDHDMIKLISRNMKIFDNNTADVRGVPDNNCEQLGLKYSQNVESLKRNRNSSVEKDNSPYYDNEIIRITDEFNDKCGVVKFENGKTVKNPPEFKKNNGILFNNYNNGKCVYNLYVLDKQSGHLNTIKCSLEIDDKLVGDIHCIIKNGSADITRITIYKKENEDLCKVLFDNILDYIGKKKENIKEIKLSKGKKYEKQANFCYNIKETKNKYFERDEELTNGSMVFKKKKLKAEINASNSLQINKQKSKTPNVTPKTPKTPKIPKVTPNATIKDQRKNVHDKYVENQKNQSVININSMKSLLESTGNSIAKHMKEAASGNIRNKLKKRTEELTGYYNTDNFEYDKEIIDDHKKYRMFLNKRCADIIKLYKKHDISYSDCMFKTNRLRNPCMGELKQGLIDLIKEYNSKYDFSYEINIEDIDENVLFFEIKYYMEHFEVISNKNINMLMKNTNYIIKLDNKCYHFQLDDDEVMKDCKTKKIITISNNNNSDSIEIDIISSIKHANLKVYNEAIYNDKQDQIDNFKSSYMYVFPEEVSEMKQLEVNKIYLLCFDIVKDIKKNEFLRRDVLEIKYIGKNKFEKINELEYISKNEITNIFNKTYDIFELLKNKKVKLYKKPIETMQYDPNNFEKIEGVNVHMYTKNDKNMYTIIV